MTLAAHGGHLGFGLFWFAETCRAYWTAKEGLGLTNRHLRKRRVVPPARSTENSASSSQQPLGGSWDLVAIYDWAYNLVYDWGIHHKAS